MGISTDAADPGASLTFWILLIAFWVIVWIVGKVRGDGGKPTPPDEPAHDWRVPVEQPTNRIQTVIGLIGFLLFGFLIAGIWLSR